MKVLFVTSTPFLMEPLGVMLLVALCRREGHECRLAILRRHSLERVVAEFRPDVVAYSTASAEINLVKGADARVLESTRRLGFRPFRVMGGPHPTFAPEVLEEMGLDAICQGDGEETIVELLRRLGGGGSLSGIPNLMPRGGTEPSVRRLERELDELPFPARDVYYAAAPYYQGTGLRSFATGRGCPYHCSYCFNHAFNRMFRECGPVMRRRSVDNVLEEIEQVRRDFPPLKLVRFADDTFAHKADDWLREFAEKYPKRIGAPFYCLMRSNTLTEETARLLAGAGCQSIGMSIESGNERLRNEVLRRNLSDETVRNSFALAKKHGIKTYASTMIGIPGGTVGDDFASLEFVRGIGPDAPIFTICTPYRGTDIWRECVDRNYISADDAVLGNVGSATMLSCFSAKERGMQQRACHLGPLYCSVPEWLAPLVGAAIRGPVPVSLTRYVGFSFTAWHIASRIFPQAIPRTPGAILRIGLDSVRYLL